MERRTRVYPAGKPADGWLSVFLLLLSVAVVISGFIAPPVQDDLSIQHIAAPTPLPLDTPFDETLSSKEITLPASQWHALQLGAFEDKAGAEAFAASFIARGAGGYVWHDGRYRVLAAVYPTKEDAQLVREQLQVQHGIDSYLYSVELPPLKIRLKGMQGQLDILEAAFIHANDLVAQMQKLSVSMDRREAAAAEAEQQLIQYSDQMQAVSLRLKQRFAAPRPASVDGLIQCFDDFSAFCIQLKSETSSVTLGAALKRQTLDTLKGLKQVYDTLQHT